VAGIQPSLHVLKCHAILKAMYVKGGEFKKRNGKSINGCPGCYICTSDDYSSCEMKFEISNARDESENEGH